MAHHQRNNNNIIDFLFFDDFAGAIFRDEYMCNNMEDRLKSSKHVEALSMTRGKSTEHDFRVIKKKELQMLLLWNERACEEILLA